MKRWTCSRTKSSNRSQVVLAFASGVLDFDVCMTCPPSLPGLNPVGYVTREDTPPDSHLHTLSNYLVIQARGLIQEGKVSQYQVKLKVGFRLLP